VDETRTNGMSATPPAARYPDPEHARRPRSRDESTRTDFTFVVTTFG
jgi:hypothetical protein